MARSFFGRSTAPASKSKPERQRQSRQRPTEQRVGRSKTPPVRQPVRQPEKAVPQPELVTRAAGKALQTRQEEVPRQIRREEEARHQEEGFQSRQVAPSPPQDDVPRPFVRRQSVGWTDLKRLSETGESLPSEPTTAAASDEGTSGQHSPRSEPTNPPALHAIGQSPSLLRRARTGIQDSRAAFAAFVGGAILAVLDVAFDLCVLVSFVAHKQWLLFTLAFLAIGLAAFFAWFIAVWDEHSHPQAFQVKDVSPPLWVRARRFLAALPGAGIAILARECALAGQKSAGFMHSKLGEGTLEAAPMALLQAYAMFAAGARIDSPAISVLVFPSLALSLCSLSWAVADHELDGASIEQPRPYTALLFISRLAEFTSRIFSLALVAAAAGGRWVCFLLTIEWIVIALLLIADHERRRGERHELPALLRRSPVFLLGRVSPLVPSESERDSLCQPLTFQFRWHVPLRLAALAAAALVVMQKHAVEFELGSAATLAGALVVALATAVWLAVLPSALREAYALGGIQAELPDVYPCMHIAISLDEQSVRKPVGGHHTGGGQDAAARDGDSHFRPAPRTMSLR